MLATVETDVLTRVFESGGGTFPPELAEYLLGLTFSEVDQERFEVLSLKSSEGALTHDQRAEFDSFANVNDILMLLQSRARRALGRPLPHLEGRHSGG